MDLMTETVVLRIKGGPTGEYDDYGNEVTGPPVIETWSAWYEPRSSGEDTVAKDQQVFGYWVYLPLDAPLSGADAVLIEGVPYEVDGEPGRQPGGSLVPGFIKAAVKRVTG
jgi:hypothetical protein